MKLDKVNWVVVFALVAMSLFAILATGWIGQILGQYYELSHEIRLTIVLTAGTVAFIAVLNITVAIFGALGLSSQGHSFGLPAGTIRAIIAVSLILIFTIISIFLYERLRSPGTYIIEGLNAEQLAEIPSEKILSSIPSSEGQNEEDQPADGQSVEEVELFDVTLVLPNNEASEDLAKQVLTTVSTLVVAISGFYFGTRSATTAQKDETKPTLKLISPATHKVKLKTDDESVPSASKQSRLECRLKLKSTG